MGTSKHPELKPSALHNQYAVQEVRGNIQCFIHLFAYICFFLLIKMMINTVTKTIMAKAQMMAIDRDAADMLDSTLSPLLRLPQLMLMSVEYEVAYSWWAQSMSFSSEP